VSSQTYPRVARPGLFRQVCMWVVLLLKLVTRHGQLLEFISCVMIAVFCAWVRSYSRGWDARAMAAFFVSVTVSALGAFAAVFNDNIPPVKRAADSGMVLGAHHNAFVALSAIKGVSVAALFSAVFHLTLYIRLNDRKMLAPRRHLEMVYVVAVHYCVNWGVSAVLCVLGQHDFQTSCVLTIGYLLWTHVFAMYTPNARQIALDSFVLDRYPAQRPIRVMCSMSPARYFIEAFTLWDSVPDSGADKDSSGRAFMLNYFSYREENLSTCLSILFTFILSLIVIRWFVFEYLNSTDFHSLYDTPLFAKFFGKLLIAIAFGMAILITAHEEGIWGLAKQKKSKTEGHPR